MSYTTSTFIILVKSIIVKIIRAKNSLSLLVYISFFLFVRCSDDKENIVITDPFEIKTFEKLNVMADAAPELWTGFDYLKTYPIYLIISNANQQKGYLLNPANIPTGSIAPESSFGLNLYRNDAFLETANAILAEFDTFIDFYFEIEGNDYFLIKYTESDNFYFKYKNQDDNYIPLVITHELFHIFQIDQWMLVPGKIQDFNNYPITPVLIALQLLMFDLMEEVYQLENNVDLETYLKFYVSIRAEEIKLDTSSNQLVTNMALAQEWREGTARYIEHFSAFNSIFPAINTDPTHGWGAQLDMVSDETSVRQVLAFRIWYHTGAAVTHILQKLGLNIETGFAQGLTPYVIAKDFLALTDNELNEYLEMAKTKVTWADYVKRAEEIFSLL